MHSISNDILWTPGKEFVSRSQLRKYISWLELNRKMSFKSYEELWQWSVNNIEEFWESIWQYFDVADHGMYDEILQGDMPGAKWFEGSKLNYAEHIFRNANDKHPAIIFSSETINKEEISWDELRRKVTSFADFLKTSGITKGDRVAAFIPNIPEASIAFLASCAIGAVWSSCSPDFGANSVIDRFSQIEPKVLIVVDGYRYNGKAYSKYDIVNQLIRALPSVEKVIVVPYLNDNQNPAHLLEECNKIKPSLFWDETMQSKGELSFEAVPFDHPLYVLYSSGTTGIPKAITHSHGGNLIEHLKYLHFHNDVHPGEKFFWFSTTGWMMWNFVHASMLAGATIVLYDGSPGYPDLNRLWQLAEDTGIHHFGTSAPFLTACQKQNINPGKDFDLSSLRSVSSTGSPLPPEAFDYVYNSIKEDVWLCSMAGGTDVCTAWVGGCPFLPVRRGEIQSRSLGASLESWNESGQPVEQEVGELVVTKPMPSMPVYFWGDTDNERYQKSYFDMYPGIWRHGDWIEITKNKGIIITGRSDATLNRGGVRIGTAEIYRALDKIPEIKDSLIINLELQGGKDFMPLFIVCSEGVVLDELLEKKIRKTLRSECSPRHVPDKIFPCPDIPYTISGKKIESPVKKVLMGKPPEASANMDSMKNPESMSYFVSFAREKTIPMLHQS
ncbi:MAG: acetoacetate--CoA ligase [Bacteroidia bacterium]|nr:acetoacetate--CoA ligase [Bacteroidia bacterium]